MVWPTGARGRRWTAEHDRWLRDLWPTMSLSDIAAVLDRSVPLVSRNARMLRLPRKAAPLWTADEDQFLRDHYPIRPTAWVARRLGRKVPQCVARAGRLGLRAERRGAAAHRGT